MLWSPAILLLIAGAAFASPQHAWKDGKEYTYKVRSRTLASFNQQSEQFTGILIEAALKVQPNGQSTLRAKIEQPRYSQIHTRLEHGWESEIPQDQMNSQNLPLSGKPFEIKMKNGVVDDLIVDKDVPTWEVNIIKSIVSQFQVDVHGENAESSKHNQLPEGDQPFALFKTMEDSVSGKCEVLYDISPLPEQVRINKPELVPRPDLREDGDMISVVKTKNYSNCDQRVSYHFGISGKNAWEPGSNSNGKYLSRSSVSRVILTGSLKKYSIQSSVTTNKVAHNSDRQENEQGMVASKMNLTLHEVKEASEQMKAPENPQSTGNLVYNYNNPFESQSSRRPNTPNKSSHKSEHDSSNSEEQKRNGKYSSLIYNRESEESSWESSENEHVENSYLQPKPKMTEAPRSPMLAFFIGNHGNSISKDNKIDPVKAAKEIAQQIGNEIHKPDSMPEEETLEKFTILSRLVRTMNAEQIAEVQRDLFEQRQSSNQLNKGGHDKHTRRNTWVAFRDAVAQAGTGPALVNVKQWIQNKQVQGYEAAHVVDAVARSARTPTPEYVKTFFEMAMMPEIKEDQTARDAAILSFADLVRNAVVDKRSAHNRYPVHAFGRLFSKSNNDVEEKYIPRMAEELKEAVNKGNSKKVQVHAAAIGNTGHPQMLSVFEPYFEGRKPVSTHQRLVMVLSLSKLAETHPKLARSVLYKIYANSGDRYEIRTAAVFLLMKTNPPASMLQRMAEFTNYDSNKQVNSAVKSTIESMAQLEDPENRDLVSAARSAQPLLTADSFRLQYSRFGAIKLSNPFTQSSLSAFANYIGSEDSLFPKGAYGTLRPTYRGMKLSEFTAAGAVSSVQDWINFVEHKMMHNHDKNNKKADEREFSPEKIAKLLGIRGDEPEQVEGFVSFSGKLGKHFVAFDNHTLDKLPEQLKQLAEEMKQGKNYEETRMNNDEITISFPTETGFPFVFTLKSPSVMSVNGQSKLSTESDSQNQSPVPKSATISGNMRFVVGMEVQKRLGFIAPFEHQEYTVGIDRKLQVHIPLRSEVEIDRSRKEVRVKVQPNENEKEYKVLQYKTQPFTTKRDILNLEPVLKDKNTHTIHKDRASSSQMNFNDQDNKQRMQFKWERQTRHSEKEGESAESKSKNNMDALKSLAKSVANMAYPNNADAEYERYSVKLTPSSDMSAEIRVSYDSSRTENSESSEEDSESSTPKAKAPTLEKGLDQHARKQKLLKEASKKINSAKANAVDITVKINGPSQASATLTAAFAKSNVDKKSRGLLFASAKAMDQEYHASAAVEGKTPNTESMDFEESLKANTPHEYDAEIHYGKGPGENHEDGNNKVKIFASVKQTEERKNQIRQSRDAQECSKQENQNGNKMTKHCKIAEQRAKRINAGEIEITFENENKMKELAMKAIDSAESMSNYLADSQKNRDERSEHNKIKMTFEVSPNDEQLDMTVKTPEGKLSLNNIKLSGSSLNLNNGNVRDSRNKQNPEPSMSDENVCSLDKTQVRTFDNRRYSLSLGQCWHVAMTTFPKNDADRPTQQHEVPEDMQVSIMTKENENGQKELKITIGDKEVEMKSSGPKENHAKVDGKEVKLSKHKSHQEKENEKVSFEIFELSDKSVKLTSDKYDVEVIFDGQRTQVKAGERYRNSVRGLCGNNDGESENDQLTPQGDLLQKSEEFSATYALTNNEKCQGPARENNKKAKDAKRVSERVRFGNVISDLEAGRESQQPRKNSEKDQERRIKYRTMVTKSDNEICFSIQPVPTCSTKSRPTETKSQKIQFHCVERTSASEKVASRVEKGANPDLSQKKLSKTEERSVPISCAA